MADHRITSDTDSLMHELRGKIRLWLLVLVGIALVGVFGYRTMEHCSWLDAVYNTVCVLTTLGLPRHPDNQAATAFTIMLALGGISTFAYAAGAVVRVMVSDEFQRSMHRRKVTLRMQHLQDHCIICGFGRIGEMVARQLLAEQIPFVIIERGEESFSHLETHDYLGLQGDAAHEETLTQAGLERARSLIVVASSDAENVLITMTARQLNPQVPIIVRCDEEGNAAKLTRVGATRVVTVDSTGAAQIALAATKPFVTDLIDLATGGGKQEIQMRQLLVPARSPAHGQSLRQLALGARFGVIVIGIKSLGQEMQFNPSADTSLAAGDTLVTVGREEKLRQLEASLAGKAN